jgi:hypothetical protein
LPESEVSTCVDPLKIFHELTSVAPPPAKPSIPPLIVIRILLLLNLGVIEAAHPVDTNDPDCVVVVAVLATETTCTTCPAA